MKCLVGALLFMATTACAWGAADDTRMVRLLHPLPESMSEVQRRLRFLNTQAVQTAGEATEQSILEQFLNYPKDPALRLRGIALRFQRDLYKTSPRLSVSEQWELDYIAGVQAPFYRFARPHLTGVAKIVESSEHAAYVAVWNDAIFWAALNMVHTTE